MLASSNRVMRRRVLLVDDELGEQKTAAARSVRALAEELRERNCEVIEALSIEDGIATISADAAIHCVFLNWTLGRNDSKSHRAGHEPLALAPAAKRQGAGVPHGGPRRVRNDQRRSGFDGGRARVGAG